MLIFFVKKMHSDYYAKGIFSKLVPVLK